MKNNIHSSILIVVMGLASLVFGTVILLQVHKAKTRFTEGDWSLPGILTRLSITSEDDLVTEHEKSLAYTLVNSNRASLNIIDMWQDTCHPYFMFGIGLCFIGFIQYRRAKRLEKEIQNN